MSAPIGRDREVERRLLDAAEAQGMNQIAYASRVVKRMDRFGAQHGDHFGKRTPQELLLEVQEEGLDVGGWTVLTMQRLAADDIELSPARARAVGDLLERIAALGAIIDQLTADAAAELSSAQIRPAAERQFHRPRRAA